MQTPIMLPDMGEYVDEVRVVRWFYAVGDQVTAGAVIAEVTTEKADVDILAPVDGVLLEQTYVASEYCPVSAALGLVGQLVELSAPTSEEQEELEPPRQEQQTGLPVLSFSEILSLRNPLVDTPEISLEDALELDVSGSDPLPVAEVLHSEQETSSDLVENPPVDEPIVAPESTISPMPSTLEDFLTAGEPEPTVTPERENTPDPQPQSPPPRPPAPPRRMRQRNSTAAPPPPPPIPTLGEYLFSPPGLWRLLLAGVIFFAVQNMLPVVGGAAMLFRLLLGLVFAVALFINFWLEAVLWLIILALIWMAVILEFFGFLDVGIFHAILMALLAFISYGLLLGHAGDTFFMERRQRASRSNRDQLLFLHDLHTSFAHAGKVLATPMKDNNILFDSGKLPQFIYPHAEPPTPMQRTTGERRTEVRVGSGQMTIPAPFAAWRLYLLTLLIESLGALGRSLVLGTLLFPIFIIIVILANGLIDPPDRLLVLLGGPAISGLLLGFFPIVLSIPHYIFPFFRTGSGEREADRFGARRPTREELQRIIDTVNTINAQAGQVGISPAGPGDWQVIDNLVSVESYTIGATIYLTSGAIESDHLAGLIAHELGHIAHTDGDLLLALRRLIIPFVFYFGIDRQPLPAGSLMATGAQSYGGQEVITDDMKLYFRLKMLPLKFMLSFWFGGLGLFLLGRSWSLFWRTRDFSADEYAVSIGQGDALLQALESYRHVDVAQPYLLSNRPYTAERIDRLRG